MSSDESPRNELYYTEALARMLRSIHAVLTIPPARFRPPSTELDDMERDAGLIRPLRCAWHHWACGTQTVIPLPAAIKWARNPAHSGYAHCAHCTHRRPVDEFTWTDGTPVGA